MDMAKRKYSKMKKIEPSVQTLLFTGAEIESDEDKTVFIDLSQCASIANRRFYRQGLNRAVSSIRVIARPSSLDDTVYCPVTVQKLPNTWVLSNAWEKGFRAWQRQQRDTLEDGTQESVKAKFNDFKIFMNDLHHSAGFSKNLLPRDSLDNEANPGEWEASQIVIPNYGAPGVNYEPYIMAVGDDVGGAGGAFSLIKAYENSRSVPQSPDPIIPGGVLNTDNIYRAMFDVGDNNEDVLENVVGKNDELPYDQLSYPGSDINLSGLEFHDEAVISRTTVSSTLHLKGGNFPCGLIGVRFNNFATGKAQKVYWDIIVDLVPGNHRGYLCEPMTEM